MTADINDFHKQAILHGLKKMFEGEHFDICIVDNACKVINAQIPTKDRAALSALHCMDFADMSPDLRKMLFTKVMEVLSGEPFFNTGLLTAAMDDGHPGGIRRLLQ